MLTNHRLSRQLNSMLAEHHGTLLITKSDILTFASRAPNWAHFVAVVCQTLLTRWSHDMATSLPTKQLTALLFFSQVASPLDLSYLHLYICFVCWDSLTAYGLLRKITVVVWAIPETLYRRGKCRQCHIQNTFSALLPFLGIEKVIWTPLHNVSSIAL